VHTLWPRGAEDGKTHYLNDNYAEDSDRQLFVARTVGYYSHPEDNLGKIIVGPTASNLLLYACFFGDSSPGIT